MAKNWKYQIERKIGEKNWSIFDQICLIFDQIWPIFGFARLFSQVSRDCETISESRLARDHARLCHTTEKALFKKVWL